MRVWRLAAFVGLLAALGAGCLGGGSSAATRHFRLVLPPLTSPEARVLLPGVLAIERPRSDVLLSERALLYRLGDDAPELHQYGYSFWTDAPAPLVQVALRDRLIDAGVADRVVLADLGVEADWTLVSRIDRLEHVVGSEPRVQVHLDVAWLRTAQREVLLAKRYEMAGTARSDAVDDLVRAMGAALARAIDAAIADLATARASTGPTRPAAAASPG